jgi:hypothetical protein
VSIAVFGESCRLAECCRYSGQNVILKLGARMNTVGVDMELGESVRAAPIAFQAIAGSWRKILIPAAFGMAIALVLAPTVGAAILMLVFFAMGPEAAGRMPSHYEPFFVTLEIAAGLIGWKVGENRGLKRNYQRFFDGLRERGAPETVPTRFSISKTGLRATSERGSFVASWTSILEVFATESHWLVQSDSFTMALPRRAFASPNTERAFIAKLAFIYLTKQVPTSDAQAGYGPDELEITPEMAAAGVRSLCLWEEGDDPHPQTAVEAVYRAMWATSPQGRKR